MAYRTTSGTQGLRRRLALLTILCGFSTTLLAQNFPNRTIKLIVPLAAGGTGDTIARAMAESMSKELGETVVVENKPGAGGLLGTEFVSAAPADGYTMLVISPSHVINPLLHADKKTYDPIRNFDPVTVMANTHQLIVAHPSVPVKNLRELIDYAKRNPGKLSYGSAGVGSATHLNMELFLQMAGITAVHVPYRGSTQARQDVISGQVQLAMDGLLPLQQFLKDGRLTPIGLTSNKRALSNPEIPLIGDVVPGYVSETWYGILVPAGTPKEIVAKLHAAAARALNSPALKERFMKLGAETVGNSPADFKKLLEIEQKTWAKMVKDTGAKAE